MKYILVIVILFSSIISMGITSSEYDEFPPQDPFDGTYYGYGDSIMNGTGGDLAPNGSDCFVHYMERTYDPANSSDRNEDGGGKTSAWGLTNFDSHVTDLGNCVIEEFGVNDWWVGTLTAAQSAQNKLDMYNKSVPGGNNSHYYPCINILADPENGMRPWKRQCDRINATESLLINYSVRFIPLYDALDTNPLNGIRDSWVNNSRYIDYVHPNKLGHMELGNFTWFFINHDDYTETRSTNSITISANYNETIYVYPIDGWNLVDIYVLCITNGTRISFTEGQDIEGNTTIQFEILKGSSYILGETIQFITIEGQGNGSTIYTPTPTINWTVVNDATMYWLLIDNNADFSSPTVNITNINEYNYPIACNINTTRVSFALPTPLSSINTYYMKVRGLI